MKKPKVSDLRIEKTPDPRRTRKPITVGKKFKMGIYDFVAHLFKLNETSLPKSRKMTDSEIIRQIKKEYPGLSGYETTKKIRKCRSEFNCGKFPPSAGPPPRELISFCYNEDGEAVNTRYNPPRPLSKSDMDKVRDHYVETNIQRYSPNKGKKKIPRKPSVG